MWVCVADNVVLGVLLTCQKETYGQTSKCHSVTCLILGSIVACPLSVENSTSKSLRSVNIQNGQKSALHRETAPNFHFKAQYKNLL